MLLQSSRGNINVILRELLEFLLASLFGCCGLGFGHILYKGFFFFQRQSIRIESIQCREHWACWHGKAFLKKYSLALTSSLWSRGQDTGWKHCAAHLCVAFYTDFCHSRGGSQLPRMWSFAILCSFRAMHRLIEQFFTRWSLLQSASVTAKLLF